MPFADRLMVGSLDTVGDAVVCVDAAGRIVLVNAQAERLFGYGREELAGRSAEFLFAPTGLAGRPAPWTAYLADPRPGQVVEDLELAGRRRDGGTFPAEISVSATTGSADDGGAGLLITAAVRDVTARREAEATAARLASVVWSCADAVVGESADRLITSWNPAAERLYGYSAAEMIGRPAAALIRPESRGEEKEVQAAIIRGEQLAEYRSDRVRKDGTPIRVSITLSPIADRAGTFVGISTVSREITGQQRAGTRFRGLVEAAPDAVVCVDSGGRIVLVNAQTERLFGYRREELVGQPVEILVPDAARAAHPAHRAGYLADPQPRPMGADLELAGRRRDGSTFPVEISLSAITPSANDGVEGILVSAAVRDVTERLELQAERERLKTQAERARLERQLQQSQRLESLGQLAGGVAHDFNNLLAVISNYAAFVRQELTSRDPAGEWQSVREDVEQIERAAERAAGLTHQLLAFARRDVVHPRALNLNHVIERVEQLLVRTLGEHVELSTELAAGLSPVLADPGQLEQVLVNLAVNARDAMPAGGKLMIATAGTDVDDDAAASRVGLTPGRYIGLKVSDTGTGMSREVIDRAFEPFFTTKATGEGTGLGLATVYGIITQAGGYVQIHSEPGVGTTFTILLPETSRPVQGASPVPAQAARSGTGETVLVVEDEAAMRELTRRILAGHGYQVITAVNGLDAIDIAARHPHGIDVLLTDVVMPQMLGKEAADRIRALCPAVQVLFMSGYSHGVLDNQGVLEPGVHLIEKPFTETSLLAKLREILSARTSSDRS